MRAWLLTNTTYGTWLPGSTRGSVTSVRSPESIVRVEHDIPGDPYEDAILELEASACELMTGPPVFFEVEHAGLIRDQFRETATYRGWTLRALAVMYNHFHLVVSVSGTPDPRKVLADFKAYGTRTLNRRFGRPASNTWWTTNGSKRRLKDDEAVWAAIRYVLEKQPNPLVLWWPTEEVKRDG